MTEEKIQLVQQSWSRVLPMADEAGLLFYDKLFSLAPEVRPLFAGDISTQANKLVTVLEYVVSRLNCLEEMLPEVKKLGVRHAGYGAEARHYEAVGESLMATLKEVLGDQWTPAVQDAWTSAYSTLKHVMIIAQSEHQPERA